MTGVLEELAGRGVVVSDSVREAFDWVAVSEFCSFLTEKNERGGFFSKTDAARIPDRHVYECAVFAYYVSRRLGVSRETKIADAGSGPGLPGYLFACLREPPQVTLIDSSRRRLSLLEEWLPTKVKDRVGFRYQRAEEMKGQYDIIVVRALIRFPFVLELLTKAVKVNGWVVRSAALEPTDKIPDEEKYLNRLGFVPRETERMPELEFLGNRSIEYFQKIRPQAPGYPRAWTKIQSEMRQWAE